jgi:hypothetical protein
MSSSSGSSKGYLLYGSLNDRHTYHVAWFRFLVNISFWSDLVLSGMEWSRKLLVVLASTVILGSESRRTSIFYCLRTLGIMQLTEQFLFIFPFWPLYLLVTHADIPYSMVVTHNAP